MVDVKRALTYAFKDKDWIKKILIGSIPIINPFFSFGYAFEVFKQAFSKQELNLPEWDDWGGYFVKSIKLIVIELIYLAVPIILFAIGAIFFWKGAAGGYDMATGAYVGAKTGMLVVGGFFYFIGGVLAFIASLILPMAFAHYVKNNEDIASALQFGIIIQKVISIIGDYLLTIVIIIGLMIAFYIPLFIVSLILGWIPILGQIIVFLLSSCVGFALMLLVFFPLFGETCAAAYGAPSTPAPPKA